MDGAELVTATPRLTRLLSGGRPNRTAVVPLIGAAAAPLAGLTPEEAFQDPQAQVEALAAAYELLRPDAVFPFMDLTAEPEALGAQVRWRPGAGPELSGPLTPAELATALEGASPDAERLPVFQQTTALLGRRLGTHTAVGAYVPGPWTLVASALGLAQASRLIRREPDLADALTTRAAAFARALMGRYAAAGATLLMVLEPCIAGGLMSPADVRRAVLPRLAEMAHSGRSLSVPVILHACGDANPVLPLLATVSCAGLSLDAPVDLADAARLLRPGMCLWGNLSPVETLLQGDPVTVAQACAGCLAGMGAFPGHVLASGCEVPLATPPGNLLAMTRSAETGA
jgi:uroporphyrinogen decarboxylase